MRDIFNNVPARFNKNKTAEKGRRQKPNTGEQMMWERQRASWESLRRTWKETKAGSESIQDNNPSE